MKTVGLLLSLALSSLISATTASASMLQDPAVGWTDIPDFKGLPGARTAFDWHRNKLVRFGGGLENRWEMPNKQRLHRNDTWEWDGKNWILMKPKTVPPAMVLRHMVYSPVSKAMVLVGGKTWEWDGKDWKSINVTMIGGWVHSLVTDWSTGMPLSFSSSSFPGNYRGRYWNGKSWQLATWKFTLPFYFAVMISDPQSKQLLAVCRGDLKATKLLRPWDVSTWTFDGKSWKLADHWKTYNWPSHMVHDAARDEFLLMTDGWPDMPNMTGWRIKGARIEPVYSKTSLPFLPRSGVMIYH